MGRQWWGIYRILVDFLDYDASITRFVKRMQARIPINLSNMKAVEGTIFTKLGTEGRRPKIKIEGAAARKTTNKFNISFACTNFSLRCAQTEIRLRLGKLQINLRFLSPCTNFAQNTNSKHKISQVS